MKTSLQSGDRGCEPIEHDAVVLHLGTESHNLENVLTVPVEVQRSNRRQRQRLEHQSSISDRERQAGPGGEFRDRAVESLVQWLPDQLNPAGRDWLSHKVVVSC